MDSPPVSTAPMACCLAAPAHGRTCSGAGSTRAPAACACFLPNSSGLCRSSSFEGEGTASGLIPIAAPIAPSVRPHARHGLEFAFAQRFEDGHFAFVEIAEVFTRGVLQIRLVRDDQQ